MRGAHGRESDAWWSIPCLIVLSPGVVRRPTVEPLPDTGDVASIAEALSRWIACSATHERERAALHLGCAALVQKGTAEDYRKPAAAHGGRSVTIAEDLSEVRVQAGTGDGEAMRPERELALPQ